MSLTNIKNALEYRISEAKVTRDSLREALVSADRMIVRLSDMANQIDYEIKARAKKGREKHRERGLGAIKAALGGLSHGERIKNLEISVGNLLDAISEHINGEKEKE